MLNSKRLYKVTLAWTSIVYAICFLGVWIFPGIRPGFMMYALHTKMYNAGENAISALTFISGLIVWDIIALIAVWLFVTLWNIIKE